MRKPETVPHDGSRALFRHPFLLPIIMALSLFARGISATESHPVLASEHRGDANYRTTFSPNDHANTPRVPPTMPSPTPVPASPWPRSVFAPYVDATAWPPLDFNAVASQLGVRFFRLGFVVAAAPTRASPSWGGYLDAGVPFRAVDVSVLRAHGGDIAIVFGGAAGTELALAARSSAELMAVYRTVILANDAHVVDFDIEGAALADRPSVDRRSQALAALQQSFARENRPLAIWFTLPVTPDGLTHDGIALVKSALEHGVTIHGVNGMAMDYGPHVAPEPDGRMGHYATQAARSLHWQLFELLKMHGKARTDAEVWNMIGVTPMIGVNDVVTEVFRQNDAKLLVAFARETRPGLISFWSLNRDRPCDAAKPAPSPGCSSISQQPYEFTRILRMLSITSTKNR